MSDRYAFFVRHLRFVTQRTPRDDADTDAMMAALERIARSVEAQGNAFTVPAGEARLAGRALAGVAGFLQQHILPETVTHGHTRAEKQVRWVIDLAMSSMTSLTTHAELADDNEPFTITLPEPPGADGGD